MVRRLIRLFFCISVLLEPFYADLYGQEGTIVFDFVNANTGIPAEKVVEIVQDQNDVIWLGGQTGLTRYNGFTVQHYKPAGGKKYTISAHQINCLELDRNGFLWIGFANHGVDYLDIRTGRFYAISLFMSDSERDAFSKVIYDIAIDGNDRVWIAGNKGIHILTIKEDDIEIASLIDISPSYNSQLSDSSPRVLLKDTLGQMWIGSTRGLFVVDRNLSLIHI